MNQSQCRFRSLARLLVGLATAALLATAQDIAGGPALALPEWLDLGAEARLRPTYRTNVSNVEEQDDGVLWTRTRLNVGVTPTPWLKFTFQGQDSRLYWRGAWRRPSENPLDVRQAYISVGRSDRSQLHVGRQELRYGDDRLIGRRNWSNFDPAWDAARLVLRRSQDQVDIFSMSFVGIDPNGFDNRFVGNRLHGFYGRIGSLVKGAHLEPYLLYSSQPRVGSAPDIGPNSGSYTTGLRFAGTATPWMDYDFELTGQRGHARAIELRGWASAASLTFGTDELPLKSRFRILHDYASGDDSRETDRLTTFDPLHQARHKHLGSGDVVGRRNVSAVTIGWDAKLHPRWRLRVSHLDFWLASRYDGLYAISGRLQVPAPEEGASSRRVGSEWDVRLDYATPLPWLMLEGGGGLFFPGKFLKSNAAGNSNRKLAYLAITFRL